MSKAQTIRALIDAATAVFSEKGYDGTSLRQIAARAGVPLSTIHMYFGSKTGLYAAVAGEIWRQVSEERIALLNQALALRGDKGIRLQDIVRALVEPVVRRACSHLPEQRHGPLLLRNASITREGIQSMNSKEINAEKALAKWIEAVVIACPNLSKVQAIWGFSFVVGALYSFELLDHRYDTIISDIEHIDADSVIDYLVNFAVGGLTALAPALTVPQYSGLLQNEDYQNIIN